MTDRTRRIISMALLLAALGMFVAFHFMTTDSLNPGWKFWPRIVEILATQRRILSSPHGVFISCFLMFSLLIISSPFLSAALSRSRIAWFGLTFFSGLAATGFSLQLVLMGEIGSPLPIGLWFLFIAPYLNFLGLLLARRWREEHRNSPIPPPNSL